MKKAVATGFFIIILGLSLSGCAALAGKTTPTPSPTTSSSSSASPSSSPKGGSGSNQRWVVGGVSFKAPPWNASQIATPFLSLLANASNNLVLEKDVNDWITVEVGPAQSNQEATQLSSLLDLSSGTITSGPVHVPGAMGRQVDEYGFTFNSPNFADSSALLGYWYAPTKTVAVACVWDYDTNGLNMQAACHQIFNSLKIQ